jgi:hypothetical protein
MAGGSKQRIFRIRKVGNFTIIDNALLREAHLSWEARGLQGYLLTKPDTWEVRMYDLVNSVQRVCRRSDV